MNYKTVNDLIAYLQALPEDVRRQEIWYLDFSFPRSFSHFVSEDGFGMGH